MGPLEQLVRNASEEGREGFRGNWVSSMALDKLLIETSNAKFYSHYKRTQLLIEMGYENLGRSTQRITSEGREGGQPNLFALPDDVVRVEGNTPAADYLLAQGYGGET